MYVGLHFAEKNPDRGRRRKHKHRGHHRDKHRDKSKNDEETNKPRKCSCQNGV